MMQRVMPDEVFVIVAGNALTPETWISSGVPLGSVVRADVADCEPTMPIVGMVVPEARRSTK
jgi:hypothetical protein